MHQLLPVLSYGDAIGGATLRTRAALRHLGYESRIYADVIDQRYMADAQTPDLLPADLGPADALIYHLSIGSPSARILEITRARKMIVYHNITPPLFFRDTSPQVEYWLERGREDLTRLAHVADLAIAVSQFNLEDIRLAGALNCVVIPPALDLERLSPRPAKGSTPPSILFVGRAAPNKRHEVLIRALAVMRAVHRRDCRLVMVGGGDDTGPYVDGLRNLASRLEVAGSVTLDARRVSDSMLGDHYAAADVFATASEHEGFCVPVIEAMAFALPVVAFASGALPETLGGAGLLLDTHDPLVWAAGLDRVLADRQLRARLVAAGDRRMADFTAASFTERLGTALRSIGVTP